MSASPGTEEYAANLALGHALQPEIATMADKTTRGRKVRQHFAAIRDELLREKDWNFASTTTTPPLDNTADPDHFTKRYVLPAECLKVRTVRHLRNSEWEVKAAIVSAAGVPVDSNVICMNIDAPLVRYTRRVETVRLWDPIFLQAFGLRLGAVLARELGKSATLAASLSQQAEAKIAVAAAVDSKETSNHTPRPATRLELARRGGRSSDPTRLRGDPG